MKSTLRQQKDLVDQIIQEGRVVAGINLLREFLRDNGYESSEECKHYAIVRLTGNCMNCTAHVQQPMPYNSDEALGALRDRLGSD